MTISFRKYKQTFYYLVASVFTYVNFLAFLISRNNAWVYNPSRAWQYASATEFRNYPASEFERTLSCYGFGQCQRIGGALFMQPIIFFAENLSKIYFWNIEDQSRIFIIQMISLSWRIASFFVLTFIIFKFSKSVAFALIYLNALMFTLSGWMLRIIGQLVQSLPIQITSEFRARSILAFQDFPHENLMWYDFGLFGALAIIAAILPKFSTSKFSILQTVLIGFLLTAFFEYLGFVFAVSLILFERKVKISNHFCRKSLQFSAFVGVGSLVWIIIIILYRNIMKAVRPELFGLGNKNTVDHADYIFWAFRHPIENLTSNPSIPFQILLVLSQSAILGWVLGWIALLCFKGANLDCTVIKIFKSITIATGLVMIFNFFIAYGVKVQAEEHSRQTLGLQISLFTYLFLRSATKKSSERVSPPA